MLVQAAGLALLAAISPTALLVAAIYLGSARPRATAGSYLAGALVMASVIGVIVLVALRSGHLEYRHARTPRYGLRLTLGVLLAAAAAGVAHRRARPRDPAGQDGGLISRLVASPTRITAFGAGLLLFAPSVTFIAAVQAIGTARAGGALTALGLALVIVIDVMLVWLPFLAYLVAPGPTTRWLSVFNGWLRTYAWLIATGALAAAGIFLVSNGLAGLAGSA